MYENPLTTINSDRVRAIIAQILKARRFDDDKFESNISQLIAEGEPDITETIADEILLRYRVKIACDLTTTQEEGFLAATSKACRSFAPLKSHLFRIKRCESVFDLNILDLSSLAVLEEDENRLIKMLHEFTTQTVVPIEAKVQVKEQEKQKEEALVPAGVVEEKPAGEIETPIPVTVVIKRSIGQLALAVVGFLGKVKTLGFQLGGRYPIPVVLVRGIIYKPDIHGIWGGLEENFLAREESTQENIARLRREYQTRMEPF
jgi:hypothetical protein